jgi:hypothetical protein
MAISFDLSTQAREQFLTEKRQQAAQAHISIDCKADSVETVQTEIQQYNYCVEASDCVTVPASVPTCDSGWLLVDEDQRGITQQALVSCAHSIDHMLRPPKSIACVNHECVFRAN